ncbi:SU10 major capsid protein, partial [Streptomyces nojiriensis]
MTIYTVDMIGKKFSIVDELLLLNPHQTPLVSRLGFADAVTNTTHEWFEDEMFSYESTAVGEFAVTDSKIKVADVEPFRPEQVVRNGDELMLVSSVNGATKEITVIRGHASTTAEPITSGSKIEVMFVEGQEGRDARQARYKKRVKKSNLTQIFDDTIEVTGTAQSVTQFGISDIYENEKQKKQVELALQLEKAIINGISYEDGDKRLMRGIRDFITTNVTNADSGELSIDMINDLAQQQYEKGAFNDGGHFAIQVGAKQKRKLSKLDDNKIIVQRADGTRGSAVDRIVTDFGEFDIVLN